MKRKLLLVVAVILVTLSCVIALTACDFFGHQHYMRHVDAVAATCIKDGNAEYWICSTCGKYFSDAEGEEEIADLNSTVIPAIGHTFSSELTSDAAYHFYKCTKCDEKTGIEHHLFSNGVCTTCDAGLIPSQDFRYELNTDNNSYSVVGCYSDDEDIIIPAEYNGLPVTGIEEEAFQYRYQLKSISIPYSVRDIKGSALAVWDRAIEIYVDTANENYSSLDGVLYNKDKTVLVSYGLAEANFTIPDSVVHIGDYAFSGCNGLTSVTISSSVQSIGLRAFYNCNGLVEVTIPDSVTNIGEYAFNRCVSLRSIAFPDCITSIGYATFSYCTSLESVVIPHSVMSIDDGAFYECSSLKSVTMPDSITSIGLDAFAKCEQLKSVYISDITSWFNIDFEEFWSVAASNPLSNGADLYLNGRVVTVLDFPSQVTEIKSFSFYGCNSIMSVVIPDRVDTIGQAAFARCESLTNVKIGKGVQNLEGDLFNGCISLESVIIPDSVTSIGFRAFSGCIGLTSVSMPNSVQSIGQSAFSNCSGLTSLTIPNGVQSIEVGAFSGCSGLASLTIGSGVKSIGESVFSGCSGLTSLTIPDGVASIERMAFNNCSGLTSVTIPDSMWRIEEWAFDGCTSLTSVYISDIAAWCGIMFSNDSSNPLYYAENNGAYYSRQHYAYKRLCILRLQRTDERGYRQWRGEYRELCVLQL